MPEEIKRGKIMDLIKSEVGFVIMVASLAISIVLFIVVPQYDSRKDIALILQKLDTIETNHLVHLQAGINEGKEKDKELEKSINDININMAEIKALLIQTR